MVLYLFLPEMTDCTAQHLCYRYVQLLWSLEIAETHHNRAFGDCFTDLQVKYHGTRQSDKCPLSEKLNTLKCHLSEFLILKKYKRNMEVKLHALLT
jgi:hypothetical protein